MNISDRITNMVTLFREENMIGDDQPMVPILTPTTLLIQASYDGQIDDVKKFVQQGADITREDNCALGLACAQGHLEVVKFLVPMLKERNIVIAPDKFSNYHPMRMASGVGHVHIVKYLTEQGIDITINNNCALRNAIRFDYPNLVKYLMTTEVDFDLALRLAEEWDNLVILEYLQTEGKKMRQHVLLKKRIKQLTSLVNKVKMIQEKIPSLITDVKNIRKNFYTLIKS